MSILGQISYVPSTAHYQIVYLTESVGLNGGDVYRAMDAASRRAVSLTPYFLRLIVSMMVHFVHGVVLMMNEREQPNLTVVAV